MKLYLAYGANTNFANMKSRCPAAKYICNITLHHHRLAFRGVADVVPQRGAKTVCALWLITPECEASLDVAEGFPYTYVKRYVTLHLRDKRHRVMFYVMSRQSSRGEFVPPEAYEECLRTGYSECGMNERQIENAIERAKRWHVAHPTFSGKPHNGKWDRKNVPPAEEPSDVVLSEDEADEFVMKWYEEQANLVKES